MTPTSLGIAGKLWLAVAAFVLAQLSISGGIAWYSLRQQQEVSVLTQQASIKLQTAQRWGRMTEVAATRVSVSALTDDAAVSAAIRAPIPEMIKSITALQQQIVAMALTDEERQQLDTVAGRRKVVMASDKRLAELKQAGDSGGSARELQQVFQPAVASYLQALRDFVAMQERAANLLQLRLDDKEARSLAWSIALTVLVQLAAIGGAALLIRSIKRPLARALTAAEQIARGDLTVQVDSRRGDELGQLLRALQAMTASLGNLVGNVRQSTDSIATASAQIATGNQDLSQRTEDTASSLQQTAFSMTELTGTVRRSADAAQEANRLASSASDAARRGGSAVQDVVSTMEGITQSSKRIGEIIGVIDGIAFQTNILALNAAVEAARAGEQGRGFAVVATEVRNLAQRSAQAAREIKSLIDDSTARVDAGSRIVAGAGETMGDIVSSIRRVTEMMSEITHSASAQSEGIGQVNQAVTQLDAMTQQNAALVEQSAAAAASLRTQAQQLAGVVGVFRIA